MISTRRSAVPARLRFLPATVTCGLDGADFFTGVSADTNALTAGADH